MSAPVDTRCESGYAGFMEVLAHELLKIAPREFYADLVGICRRGSAVDIVLHVYQNKLRSADTVETRSKKY